MKRSKGATEQFDQIKSGKVVDLYIFKPQGLQRRRGDCELLPLDGFVGVTGRSSAESGSARRMNCSGVNGEPFVEGDDPIDRGL